MRLFLVAALAVGGVSALVPPLAGQAGRISYDTFSLANGLQVITSEDHSTPVVAVDVWYNTGSRNERIGRSGFAHLFEHMMFQGSAHVKKTEHFQLVERAGGEENGSTQEDRTNYYDVVPSNRLNLVLWLEADRMRSLAITQENFENQRETVKEERRLRVDNQPYSRAFVDGLTLPYDSTACFAYAHSTIGDMADLNAAKLPDVQAFFDTYYAPNNARLVVVGDFNPTELRRLIRQYYADIPRHDPPPAVSCDYKLNIILGQGESSRLNVAIVRRAKAALAAGAGGTASHRGPGTMFAFGIANQGIAIDRVDSLLVAQLDTLRQNGVTPDELTKAKNTLRAGFIQNRETALSKAEELQHYAMFHDDLAEINTDLDHFMAVTNDDIRRVAGKYLDSSNAVILLIKPAGGGQ